MYINTYKYSYVYVCISLHKLTTSGITRTQPEGERVGERMRERVKDKNIVITISEKWLGK